MTGTFIFGSGYTVAAGVYWNAQGSGYYARAGVGAGLDVNVGTEGGQSESSAAFSGESETNCAGVSVVNGCVGGNKNGSTISGGGQIGPTEVKASGHTEKTYTWMSKPHPPSKPHDYRDCTKPQPGASVCNK